MSKRLPLPMDEIVAAYREGVVLDELGRRFGVSSETIRKRLREAGVAQGPQRARDIAFLAEVMTLLAGGASYDEVGQRLGISARSLRERVRRVCWRMAAVRDEESAPRTAP